MKRLAFGCDPNAQELKEIMIRRCWELGYEVEDLGSVNPIYAKVATEVAEYVAAGKADKGVLICGTGLGVSISANKVKGAYAALITDAYSAQRAALSNDANIACFGAFTLGTKLAVTLLEIWLALDFDPNSPSKQKVDWIKEYEKRTENFEPNSLSPECVTV